MSHQDTELENMKLDIKTRNSSKQQGAPGSPATLSPITMEVEHYPK